MRKGGLTLATCGHSRDIISLGFGWSLPFTAPPPLCSPGSEPRAAPEAVAVADVGLRQAHVPRGPDGLRSRPAPRRGRPPEVRPGETRGTNSDQVKC